MTRISNNNTMLKKPAVTVYPNTPVRIIQSRRQTIICLITTKGC
jgi:hypothetical protein